MRERVQVQVVRNTLTCGILQVSAHCSAVVLASWVLAKSPPAASPERKAAQWGTAVLAKNALKEKTHADIRTLDL